MLYQFLTHLLLTALAARALPIGEPILNTNQENSVDGLAISKATSSSPEEPSSYDVHPSAPITTAKTSESGFEDSKFSFHKLFQSVGLYTHNVKWEIHCTAWQIFHNWKPCPH